MVLLGPEVINLDRHDAFQTNSERRWISVEEVVQNKLDQRKHIQPATISRLRCLRELVSWRRS